MKYPKTTSIDTLLSKKENLTKIDNHKYSENIHLMIFALSVTCFGLNNFHIKVMKLIYLDDFDIFRLGMWRNIWTALFSYFLMNKRGIPVIPFKNLEKNFWFWIRILAQTLSLILLTISLEGLRVGTANCFISMNPVATVILSPLILKERFHIRYAIGIVLCLIGILMMIFNERSSKNLDQKPKELYIVVISIIAGIFNLLTVSISGISSKILLKQNINQENQVFYMGAIAAPIYGVFILRDGVLFYSLDFILHSVLNSIIYALALYFLIIGVRGVDISKTTPINYLSTVILIILGIIFLGEPLFVLDVIGCSIIIGYNIYNSVYPIKWNTNN
jgi:drug/metabolite transporter (DMT)-like permease